jgi:hypothetical protein
MPGEEARQPTEYSKGLAQFVGHVQSAKDLDAGTGSRVVE